MSEIATKSGTQGNRQRILRLTNRIACGRGATKEEMERAAPVGLPSLEAPVVHAIAPAASRNNLELAVG